MTALLPATYSDVVVRTPYRVGGGRAVVLVGDAAHAMSPQLGCGTSLALADAHVLAEVLASGLPLEHALAEHARARAAHVRWYAWCSRLMMPVFQSDLDLLAPPRDRLAPLVAALPGVAPLLVGTLSGDRTSPWTRARLA